MSSVFRRRDFLREVLGTGLAFARPTTVQTSAVPKPGHPLQKKLDEKYRTGGGGVSALEFGVITLAHDDPAFVLRDNVEVYGASIHRRAVPWLRDVFGRLFGLPAKVGTIFYCRGNNIGVHGTTFQDDTHQSYIRPDDSSLAFMVPRHVE